MPLTAQDIFLAARDRLLALTDKYSPEAIDKEGNDVNVCLRLMAGVGEELSLESSTADNGHYLATVASISDDAVDRLVSDITGGKIQRFREEAAIVDVRFSRSNTYALAIDAGAIVTTSADGIPFRTIDQIAWSTGDNTPKTVACLCELTGLAGNVAMLTITKTSGDFGDKTISVTNPTVASGGRVAETSIELISRARDWFLNASRGTLSAIEFGARQTPGVVQASATELTMAAAATSTGPGVTEVTQLPFYRVRMVIGDVSGQAGSALARKTRETLQEYRCAGVPVLLTGGTLQYEQVVWTGLGIKKGFSQASVLADLAAKIVAASKLIVAEQPLERSLLISIAKSSVDGIISVPDEALVTPAEDKAAAPGYAIRIRPEDISFT
jgi:hypothetical protein